MCHFAEKCNDYHSYPVRAIENLNILPFTHNFKQNSNAQKFSTPLTPNVHNLIKNHVKQMQSKNRFEQSKSWAFL